MKVTWVCILKMGGGWGMGSENFSNASNHHFCHHPYSYVPCWKRIQERRNWHVFILKTDAQQCKKNHLILNTGFLGLESWAVSVLGNVGLGRKDPALGGSAWGWVSAATSELLPTLHHQPVSLSFPITVPHPSLPLFPPSTDIRRGRGIVLLVKWDHSTDSYYFLNIWFADAKISGA